MKNKILRGLAYMNGLMLATGISGIDSTGIYYNIFLTMIIVSMVWLLLFYIANYEYFERKYDE